MHMCGEVMGGSIPLNFGLEKDVEMWRGECG
jgi:hypothetical protein